MSLGVNMVAVLTRRSRRRFDEAFDIEIVERQHNQKSDAPHRTLPTTLGEAEAEGPQRST